MNSKPACASTRIAPRVLLLALAVSSIFSPSAAAQKPGRNPAPATANLPVAGNYGKLPLAFEANQGQSDSPVKFLSRGAGFTLFLTGDQAVLALRTNGRQSKVDSRKTPPGLKDSVLVMRLAGANPHAAAKGTDELPGKSNYLIGNDPGKWRTHVPNFSKVRYEGVYPGVDLVYYGNQRRLEYDLVVAPGTDPGVIRLDVGAVDEALGAHGHGSLRIDSNGDLVVRINGEELRFEKPVIYQPASTDGKQRATDRTPVEGHYRLVNRQVKFEIARYDRTRPLIIDPALNLTYSTYLGGSGDDTGQGIAIDAAGNAYITGQTSSTNFPTVSGDLQTTFGGGSLDAYVTKLNSTGTAVVYSTYLGGSGDDIGSSIAVDASGYAYITGYTNSANFPTTPGALQTASIGQGYDAFVTKLSPDGSSLVYSTYLGGSADDSGNSIAIDSGGNAYVAGNTLSTDFPVTKGTFQTTLAGGQDAFVTELNATGSALIYSTYLGGTMEEFATAIALDSAANAYITGFTLSTDFPTTSGAFQATAGGSEDAFVTKLNASGTALVYSTYLGGNATDDAFAIALDASGDAYVVGLTTSTNFPTTPNALQPLGMVDFSIPDGFVTKLNPSGSTLVYSTYLGGCGNDQAYGVAVNSAGNAYVTGTSNSSNFPPLTLFECRGDTGYSPFLTKFDSTGSGLINPGSYSSFVGPYSGEFGNPPDQGNGIALDSAGNAYIVGTTNDTTFQTTAGAFQSTYGGGNTDAFVLSFANTPQSFAVFSPSSLTISQPVGTTSPAQNVTFTNGGDAALTISSISVTSDFAQTNNCPVSPATLAAGANCTISVTFTPPAVGNQTGTLTVANDSPNGAQTINLTGTGTSGAVALSASSLTFPPQHTGTTSAPQMITLTNSGTTALTVNSLAITNTVFAQSNNCPVAPATLAAGQNCVISVTFTPSAVGTVTGSLTISDSAANSPQTVTLTGTAGGPADATVTPTSLTFGSQQVMTTSAAQTVTVTNTGTVSLSITTIAVSGDFGETTSCGTIVPTGTSCTINVTFTPTAIGTRTGSLTITDNALVSPAVVSLTGTGVAPVASLSSTSLTLTGQIVGTSGAAQSVTLTNGGNAALTITALSITGTNAGDFAIQSNSTCSTKAAVAAGASCAIDVSFKPTAGGSRSGSLTITDNAAGSPQTVALSGTGQDFSPAVVGSSTATISAGQSATYRVQLTSLGDFSGSVTLACSGAPAASTCSTGPSGITVTAGGGPIADVTVTTTARSSILPWRLKLPPAGRGPLPAWPFSAAGVIALLLAALCGVAGFRSSQAHARRPVRVPAAVICLALLLAATAMLVSACGGGSSTSTGSNGTPAGTYSLTVTATSGALSHSVKLTLVVN